VKKFLSAGLAMICILMFCTGCGEIGNSPKQLTAEEAIKFMQTEQNYIILDVRTQEEYDKKHIPKAVLLPIEEIRKGNFSEKLPDKNKNILIYCWTGRRAEDSAKILAENGYKNVYEFGGLIDWTGEVEGKEVSENNN